MSNDDANPVARSRQRRLQFRLSSLMVLVVAVAAWLGYYFSVSKRAERAVDSLQAGGAEVYFDYQRHPDSTAYSHLAQPPGPAAVRKLAGEGFFQDAEWVRLHDTPLTPDALAPLAQLPSLQRITLTNCRIDDRHLVHFHGLPRIELLDLKDNQITDAGLLHLRGMTRLEILSLSKNAIRGDGLEHLVGLERLKQLFLRDNPIADDNLAHIGKLASLEMLGLAGTKVTDDGLPHLANLQNLTYLGLTRTDVTEAGVTELQVKLPNCKIEH